MNGICSFTPKFLAAPEYVFALHGPSDQVAVLVRNRTLKQTTQRILPAETIASSPFQAWLHEQNHVRRRHIHWNESHERWNSPIELKKTFAKSVMSISTWTRTRALRFRRYAHPARSPRPTFVLDTSPGKHQVVWRVDGLDREQAEALASLALANQFGGDPAATDVSRVLRLPGFTNKKYNEAFVVRVHHETDQVYHLGDFQAARRLTRRAPPSW